jgi:hypothetical protein
MKNQHTIAIRFRKAAKMKKEFALPVFSAKKGMVIFATK